MGELRVGETPTAAVYVNWSRTVCDCPHEGCYDAAEVTPGQQQMICTYGHVSTVRWPRNMPAIMSALEKRVDKSKRNWFPKDHRMAVIGGYPQNQTPAELEEERAFHEQAEQARAEKRQQAAELLRELGVEVGPDGTVRGKL